MSESSITDELEKIMAIAAQAANRSYHSGFMEASSVGGGRAAGYRAEADLKDLRNALIAVLTTRAAAFPAEPANNITAAELRIKIGAVAHVQDALRGMLIDEILSDIELTQRTPLTNAQVDEIGQLTNSAVQKLESDGRYTFAAWLPIAVRLTEKAHRVGVQQMGPKDSTE